MRCEECGARNPQDASWCTQCFTPLAGTATNDLAGTATDDTAGTATNDLAGAATNDTAGTATNDTAGTATTDTAGPDGATPDDGPRAPVQGLAAQPLAAEDAVTAPDPTAPPAPPVGDAAATGALPAPAVGATPHDGPPEVLGGGAFRRTAEGLEWSCRTCAEWNPLERVTCRVCASPFGTDPAATAAAPVADVPPALLAAASVVAPGAGHVLLGRTAEGVARLLLALVWALGGIVLLQGALDSGRPPLPALPLLFGWFLLAVACTNDAMVLGGVKGQVLLGPRVLLWLVVGVVGLTAVGALVGVLAVTGG